MTDATAGDLGSIHGGQAGDCYYVGLAVLGIDIGIWIGDCPMPGSTHP